MALRLIALPPVLCGTVWCLSVSHDPHKDERLSTPKLYGHTSNVHPFNGDRDREWYVEARWADGAKHESQGAGVTVRPLHVAPVVPPTPAQEPSGSSGRLLNDRPDVKPISKSEKESAGQLPEVEEVEEFEAEKTSKVYDEPKVYDKPMDEEPMDDEPMDVEASEAAEAEAPEPPKSATDPTVETVLERNRKSVRRNDHHSADHNDHHDPSVSRETRYKAPHRRTPAQHPGHSIDKKPEVRYAVPKLYGHTSKVHPFKGNRDREWYTEARWKPGREYKPQDGVITELPVHSGPPAAPVPVGVVPVVPSH